MASLAAPRFHRLRISDVRRETPDAVSIAFDVPEVLKPAYRFTPGQYLTVRTSVAGEELRRSYSICSGPEDGELRIAVKRVDSGSFSTWANAELHEGDELDVMTPTGRFGLPLLPGTARTYAGFAAGSGITPILSILRGVLSGEPGSRFFLFYGNRSLPGMLFREALDELKDRYLDRLSVFHVLSQEQQDIPILNGRIDAEKVRVLLRHVVPVQAVDEIFVCGPLGMSEAVETTLRALGVPQARIHVERFVSSYRGTPRRKDPPLAPEATRYVAALIVDGKRTDIPVAEDEAVLDAALRAGLDLPYACKGGMCSTCRARIVAGTVSMDVNYSLEPWEVAAGYVLTCQAHPVSDRVVIDYDQV
jgi:ring-1,2-phenylacetyl-CoA epoxidase subunit PaaE